MYAQHGCTTVWTPSTWCLNTKHVMGWDENVNPLSGQSKGLENHLFILFQHFAGYTTLYYVDGQQVESIGTSPWCIIYDVLFPLTASRYSSDHLPTTPRCNGSFCHSAEPQRPRCFFMAPTRLWCLGQGTWGMHQV